MATRQHLMQTGWRMNRTQDRQLPVRWRQETTRQSELRTHRSGRDAAARLNGFGRFRDQYRRDLTMQIARRMVVRMVSDFRAGVGQQMCLVLLGMLVGVFVDLGG